MLEIQKTPQQGTQLKDNRILEAAELIVQVEYEKICGILGEWGLKVDPRAIQIPANVAEQMRIEARWGIEPNLPR